MVGGSHRAKLRFLAASFAPSRRTPQQFGGVLLEDFYRAINNVKPGFIRVDSDEVTYNLHVVVRFEIEKALMEERSRSKRSPTPGTANARIPRDLPRVRWPGMPPGYPLVARLYRLFPHLYPGESSIRQIFEAFEKAHPNWKEHVAQGSLDFIRDWLKENIHRHGRQFTPGQLCQRVTGKPLSQEPYVGYLTKKYRGLYRL